MQEDFHYYATYCAAYIAGFSHEESMAIGFSSNFCDHCSKSFLSSIKAPHSAATTQLSLEMMDANTDIAGLQDITRIWASFHFLPADLYADVPKCGKLYRSKYRLICGPNSDLVEDTVRLAKDKSVQAAGVAMHVLADTWAHRYFAGTPSLVINNINYHFYEILPDKTERKINFKHSPSGGDDVEKGIYSASLFQGSENNIMNLGHGRAGHFPDYSFARYRYLPAWGKYKEIIKDNPSDYYSAFTQMICALKYLKGVNPSFEKNTYDTEAIKEWDSEIRSIFEKRQVISCDDWKAFGERLSGKSIDPFEVKRYNDEYVNADKDSKNDTFLGKFILAALSQKSMVTNRIYTSGNKLAGISVDYSRKGLKGMKDFFELAQAGTKGGKADE